MVLCVLNYQTVLTNSRISDIFGPKWGSNPCFDKYKYGRRTVSALARNFWKAGLSIRGTTRPCHEYGWRANAIWWQHWEVPLAPNPFCSSYSENPHFELVIFKIQKCEDKFFSTGKLWKAIPHLYNHNSIFNAGREERLVLSLSRTLVFKGAHTWPCARSLELSQFRGYIGNLKRFQV